MTTDIIFDDELESKEIVVVLSALEQSEVTAKLRAAFIACIKAASNDPMTLFLEELKSKFKLSRLEQFFEAYFPPYWREVGQHLDCWFANFMPFEYLAPYKLVFIKYGNRLAHYDGGYYLFNGRGWDLLDEEFLIEDVSNHITINNIPVKPAQKASILKEALYLVRKYFTREISEDILCLSNGILDLKRRTLVEYTPTHFFVNEPLEYDYDPEQAYQGGVFSDFLTSSFDLDAVLVQEMMGYLLTNNNISQKMFMLIGPPASGKSTLLNIIEKFIGSSSFGSYGAHDLEGGFGLASVVNKKVASFPELRLGKISDRQGILSKLLSLAGGDKLTLDRKYKNPVEVNIEAKVILMSNEMPVLPDSSNAISRRLIYIEAKKSFVDNPDMFLINKLRCSLPAILNFALDGLERLRKNNYVFSLTHNSRRLTEEARANNNPVYRFTLDCLEEEYGAELTLDELHDRFKDWAEREGFNDTRKPYLAKSLRDLYRDKYEQRSGRYGPSVLKGYRFTPINFRRI